MLPPILRTGILALLALLAACSGNETLVKRNKPASAQVAAKPHTHPTPQPAKKLSASYYGVFAKPAALDPAVGFWRKTYTQWRRAEVAFHDDRNLDVIYEVMQLPGYVAESLTAEQKDLVAQRRAYWEEQLKILQSKLRYHAPLDANDKNLLTALAQSGKPPEQVLQGAEQRVRSQRGTRERFKRGLEISGRYDLEFRRIFRQAGLPEDLAYLPHVESSFQPSARSSAGAVGMWQFTKGAAKTFMPGGRVDLRLDPIESAKGAANYLNYAYGKLGDWALAITSYNHGIGGMKRAQNQVGSDFVRIVDSYDAPSFGFASRNYYAQFLAALEIARDPLAYFPEGVSYESPLVPGQMLAED